MSLAVDRIEEDARTQTGLDDTGGDYYREGLERLVESMNVEGGLTEMGEAMQQMRLSMLLAARLGVEETYRLHPEIDDEVIDGPVFVIGLPRTGTTALSQLVAADPQFRSLRTWESASPVPPPEKETEHTDPRIAATEQGIAMMNEAFPLMQTMHHTEATDRHRVPGPHGHELPNRPLRWLRTGAVLYELGHRHRYEGDLPLPPTGAAPAPVALPAHLVAPEDAGAHVRPR